MKSLRRGLLLALCGTMCIAMLFGGWATYLTARDEADRLFDYHLEQIALSLRDQRFQGSAEALASDVSLDYVIRIWDSTGLTIFFSKPHDRLPELTRLGYSTTETHGETWRLYAIQYHGQTIAVAQPMRVRDRLAARSAWKTLTPFLVLLPVLCGLIWWMVGRGLRPLGQLAHAVQARTPNSLEALSVTEVPTEVQPLVVSLNDLLERLKVSLDAQRAFVADAAHELRSPLTALQLQMQLTERAPSESERTTALSELKIGLQRTTHTVQQMLTLARQEPGAIEAVFVEVDLGKLTRESVIDHAQLATLRNIDLGIAQTDEKAVVMGDPVALKILLANLVSNALHYTPYGGQVDVSCGIDGRHSWIEVVDNGPGIPPEERERVFDRFYRRAGEMAQEKMHETGSGLGLAIVKTIATRHEACVELLDAATTGGLRVRVSF